MGDIEIGVVIHGRIRRATYDLLIHLYLPLFSLLWRINKSKSMNEAKEVDVPLLYPSFIHSA